MELTERHLKRVRESMPVERGNVSMEVLKFLNAVLYVMENGCKWGGCRSASATGTRSTRV